MTHKVDASLKQLSSIVALLSLHLSLLIANFTIEHLLTCTHADQRRLSRFSLKWNSIKLTPPS